MTAREPNDICKGVPMPKCRFRPLAEGNSKTHTTNSTALLQIKPPLPILKRLQNPLKKHTKTITPLTLFQILTRCSSGRIRLCTNTSSRPFTAENVGVQ